MAQEFRLPDIGEGLTEAEIIEWRVSVGDTVEMDQVVVEVETDKAVVELPVPFGGVVLALGGEPGQVIEVGSVLVVVGEPGEQLEPGSAAEEPAPIVGTLDTEVMELPPTPIDAGQGSDRPRALPIVRKLARALGVDIDTLDGSGPDGRVTREDVEAAAVPGSAPAEPAAQPDPEPPPATVPDQPAVAGARRPMSALRRAIADSMTKSWSEIPQVTTFGEVDATRLLEVKKALSQRHGRTISMDALVCRAVLPALREYPDFNARIEGSDLVDPDSIDLGLAVDAPAGLMVVVVRDTAALSLVDLSARIESLAAAATSRTASVDQLTGQSFTISNIGAVGGGFGTPIVPYGTTAILSVGRAMDSAVAKDGVVVIAPMMPLSLSYDHRVVDGAAGRRFLGLVAENLAEPALFLAD